MGCVDVVSGCTGCEGTVERGGRRALSPSGLCARGPGDLCSPVPGGLCALVPGGLYALVPGSLCALAILLATLDSEVD